MSKTHSKIVSLLSNKKNEKGEIICVEELRLLVEEPTGRTRFIPLNEESIQKYYREKEKEILEERRRELELNNPKQLNKDKHFPLV